MRRYKITKDGNGKYNLWAKYAWWWEWIDFSFDLPELERRLERIINSHKPETVVKEIIIK